MTDVPDPQPPAPEASVDEDRSTIWLAIEAGVYGPGRDKRPAAYEALERFAARLREAEHERDEAQDMLRCPDRLGKALARCADWKDRAERLGASHAELEDVKRGLQHLNDRQSKMIRSLREALRAIGYEADDGLCWCPHSWFYMDQQTGEYRPDDDHSTQCAAARRALAGKDAG